MKHLFWLMILTGCTHKPTYDVTPEALSYVASFEADSIIQNRPVHINDLIIVFDSELPNGTLGSCYYEPTPRVVINPIWWSNANPIYREIMMYHELGHCILKRGHTFYHKLMKNDFYPISLMYTSSITPDVYENNKEYYVHELFYPYYEVVK